MIKNNEGIAYKNEKRLKRKTEFDILDSAIGCLLFIFLEILFLSIYKKLPIGIISNGVVLVFAQIIIEGLFFLNVILTSNFKNVEWVEATNIRKKITLKNALYAVIITCITMICFAPLSNLFIYAVQSIGFKYYSSYIDVSSFLMYIVALFVHCAVPAFTEEILFRGMVCNGLKKVNTHLAVILSALMFSLMHGTPLQTIHQFVIGIVLGYVFIKSSNLWIPILIHFLNNSISITAMFIQTMMNPELKNLKSQLVKFEPVPNNVLLMNILYTVLMLAIGVFLIVIILKKMTKDNKLKELEVQECGVQNNQKNENLQNLDVFQNKKKNIVAIIGFVLAGFYLVFEWVVALLKGMLL